MEDWDTGAGNLVLPPTTEGPVEGWSRSGSNPVRGGGREGGRVGGWKGEVKIVYTQIVTSALN